MNTHLPILDAAHVLSDGASAVTVSGGTQAVELGRQPAYWQRPHIKEDELSVVVYVTDMDLTEGNTYNLALQSDSVSNFTDDPKVLVEFTPLKPGNYRLPISRAHLNEVDPDGRYLRVFATLAGPSPSITFRAYAVPAKISGGRFERPIVTWSPASVDFSSGQSLVGGVGYGANIPQTRKGVGSMWFQPTVANQIWNIFTGRGFYGVTSNFQGGDTLTFFAWSESFNVMFQNVIFGADEILNEWNHIGYSFDVDQGICDFMFNGGIYRFDPFISGTHGHKFIDFNQDAGEYAVVGSNTGGTKVGGAAEVWVDFTSYIDLFKFPHTFVYDKKPVYLGPNGEIPLGRRPQLYHSGGSVAFEVNKGSLPSFSYLGGTPTTHSGAVVGGW